MLNKTYLLTASRNPGFKLEVPRMRTPRFGEAFRRCRERGTKTPPCRTQKNKSKGSTKRRNQPC